MFHRSWNRLQTCLVLSGNVGAGKPVYYRNLETGLRPVLLTIFLMDRFQYIGCLLSLVPRPTAASQAVQISQFERISVVYLMYHDSYYPLSPDQIWGNLPILGLQCPYSIMSTFTLTWNVYAHPFAMCTPMIKLAICWVEFNNAIFLIKETFKFKPHQLIVVYFHQLLGASHLKTGGNIFFSRF